MAKKGIKVKDKLEDYDGFVEKFKPKKTTDDCYTPPEVYDVIKGWVNDRILSLEGIPIVRPFFPGGDYENYDYPDGCVVLDNPPFSILAKIRRFYHERGIRYFLFGPGLTLFATPLEGETFIVSNANITYENGAVVRTGFITNLIPARRIWVTGEISARLAKLKKSNARCPKYELSPNVVTSAVLQRLCREGVELVIPPESCEFIRAVDSMKTAGKALFGGGYLITERAAAERAAAERAAAERAAAERAAAERAAAERAAAERAAAEEVLRWPLSEAEKLIIKNLK